MGTNTMSLYSDALLCVIGDAIRNSGMQSKVESCLSKMDDNADSIKFANKIEDECDEFIRRISKLVGDPDAFSKKLAGISEEMALTLYIRISTFEEYAEQNPDHSIPLMIGGSEGQVVIDCLINFWKAYCHTEPLDFLRR